MCKRAWNSPMNNREGKDLHLFSFHILLYLFYNILNSVCLYFREKLRSEKTTNSTKAHLWILRVSIRRLALCEGAFEETSFDVDLQGRERAKRAWDQVTTALNMSCRPISLMRSPDQEQNCVNIVVATNVWLHLQMLPVKLQKGKLWLIILNSTLIVVFLVLGLVVIVDVIFQAGI